LLQICWNCKKKKAKTNSINKDEIGRKKINDQKINQWTQKKKGSDLGDPTRLGLLT
jgi:hypothetical protein